MRLPARSVTLSAGTSKINVARPIACDAETLIERAACVMPPGCESWPSRRRPVKSDGAGGRASRAAADSPEPIALAGGSEGATSTASVGGDEGGVGGRDGAGMDCEGARGTETPSGAKGGACGEGDVGGTGGGGCAPPPPLGEQGGAIGGVCGGCDGGGCDGSGTAGGSGGDCGGSGGWGMGGICGGSCGGGLKGGIGEGGGVGGGRGTGGGGGEDSLRHESSVTLTVTPEVEQLNRSSTHVTPDVVTVKSSDSSPPSDAVPKTSSLKLTMMVSIAVSPAASPSSPQSSCELKVGRTRSYRMPVHGSPSPLHTPVVAPTCVYSTAARATSSPPRAGGSRSRTRRDPAPYEPLGVSREARASCCGPHVPSQSAMPMEKKSEATSGAPVAADGYR